MTFPTRWWRAAGAWQKAALLALPAALVVVVVLVLVLDPWGTPPEAKRSAAAVGSEAPDLTRGLVVFDGCSLVDDSGVSREDGMPAQAMALLPAGLDWKNLGVGGQTTVMMAADAVTEVDPLFDPRRPVTVLVAWEGTNDLIYGTSPPYYVGQAYRHLAAYCRARQRAGFRVVVCTVLPRGGSATFYRARNSLNAELRAHWRSFADGLADVAADETIGPDGAEADTTYYRDLVHLTPAGYAIVADDVAAAVKRLL